ncbi:MAG: hypothetical protein Q7U23_08055 [Methylococcales bacterium]|nr:hypothetical protein [Methylococcales bacterium]
MAQDLQIEAYCKFWNFYTKEKSESCSLVSYEKYKADPVYTMGFIYDCMEPDYTREIINALNRFAHEIDVIETWSNHIFPDYSEDEQFELSWYFLQLPLYYCLNQPHSIRDRLIFCATHLCHQANIFNKTPEYKDDLPEDWRIKKKELIKRAKFWNANNNLLNALDNVASDNFKEKTFNYRNMAHHQIPPSLEYGTANYVTRIGYKEETFEYTVFENGVEVKKTKTTKGVSYGFGGTPPLKSKDLIDDLKQQLELLKIAFEAYWAMILEHNNHNLIRKDM